MKAFAKIKELLCRLADFLSLKIHWPWCAALFIIVLAFFGKYMFSSTQVVSQLGTDVYTYYLHAQTFTSAEIAQGNLPLWNPYTYGGHPYLADFQSALLYPPTWFLSYVFNPVTAINWWVALHVFIFGLLTYTWAVCRGCRPAAAFVAGVAAMFGGTFYMHVYAGHISNLGSMAWAPLVFIGIDGWLRSKNAGWVILGAAGAALQVYAGHPQYVYYTAIAAGIYSLLNLPYWGHHFRRTAFGLLAIYPLAVLLAAAQLFPGYFALSEGVRGAGSAYDFASMFSFCPENIFTVFAPWLYGGAPELGYWGRCYLWEMQLYFGIGMMVLAAFGFAGLSKGDRWRTGILLGALLILALGAYTPIYYILYKLVPLFGSFRGTSKFVFLIGLFVAMLAGKGMQRLLDGEVRSLKAGIAAASAGAVVLFAGLLFRSGALSGVWESIFSNVSTGRESYFQAAVAFAQNPAFKEKAAALFGNGLLAGGAWLLLFGGLLITARQMKAAVWATGACAILNLGLFAYNATTGFTASEAQFQAVAKMLKDNPGDYRTLNLGVSSANMSWRNDGIWGYDPSVLKRYAEYVYFSQGLNPGTASQNPPFTQLGAIQKNPLLSLLRCRLAMFPDGNQIRIVETGEALPRFMILSEYEVIKDRDTILKTIASPDFNPKQKVILESTPVIPPDKGGATYTVRLLGITSDFWTLEIICDKATLLVMTDAYAEGWVGTTLPGSVQTNYDVMPANYAMRAIPLSAGRHLVKVEYKQPGLVGGLKTSLFTSLALCLMIFVPAFRRKLDFAVDEKPVMAESDITNFETITCALCGSGEHELVCQKAVPGGRLYNIVQCKKCGLVFVNPRLKQEIIMATYRDSAYFQRGQGEVTGYNDYTVDRELHVNFFTTQIDSIERVLSKRGRLLDIGCAFGYLLDNARTRGWQVEGIELSGNALRYSRDTLKLNVHDKPLRDVAFPDGTFNAVVMDDVIEHYGDPASEVKEVARVLAKGGAFLLHTPNYDSPWRPIMGERWVHLKPEEHLYYFSPKTLSEMLRKNGFEIVYARARGKATNLAYIMGVSKKYMPWLGSLLERTIGRLPLARRTFSFRGGGMEVLAIKK